MSMPVREFTCTKCNFIGGDVGIRGMEVYLLPHGIRLPVSTVLWWCEDCSTSLIRAEELSERKCQLDLVKTEARLAAYPKRPVRSWWQLGRCFIFNRNLKQGMADWERGRLRAETDIGDLEELLQLLRGRAEKHDSARCLRCGGCRIQAADPAGHVLSENPNVPDLIGLTHPGCGGQLLSQFNMEFWIAMRRKVRNYAPDGAFISEEQGSDPYDPDHSPYGFKTDNARIRRVSVRESS